MSIIILNTVVEPFGATVWIDKEAETVSWKNHKDAVSKIYELLERTNVREKKIDWIGGISGPGGFTGVRVSSVMISLLGELLNADIKSIRAEEVASFYLNKTNRDPNSWVLNSFANTVWMFDEKMTQVAIEKIKNPENLWGGFLPEGKKKKLEGIQEDLPEDFMEVLKEVLEEKPSLEKWIAHYDVPAVKGA